MLQQVDGYSRTNIPSIWAIGDVTNRMNLTPVALMEGTCFAKTVFGGEPTEPDYGHIPCAVCCIPPLSVAGLSEEQAIEQANGDLLVFTSSFNPMKNTISGRTEKTVMKLVVDAETDKVLGASMCGPDAPEIMQGIAIALKCGATKAQFDSMVGIYPSAVEEFVTMRSVSRRVTAADRVAAIEIATQFQEQGREVVKMVDEDMDVAKTQIILAKEYLKDVSIGREQLMYIVMEARLGGCQGHRAELYAARVAKCLAAFEGRYKVGVDDLKKAVMY